MPFQLPPRFRPAWQSLARMDEPALDRFVSALERSLPQLTLKQLTDEAVEKVGTGEIAVRPLVALLRSLSAARSERPWPVEEVVADLRRDCEELGGDFIPKIGWETFARFLARALRTPALVITGKALDVMVANEHIYLSSRVLTDLRPVFGDDVTASAPAGVIIHTLRLEYGEGHKRGVFSLTLDGADVVQLREALDRALQKADTAERQFNDGGFRILRKGDAS